MKILVLEDDIERIEEFRKRFQNVKGIENVDFCYSAKVCIELLKKEKYSLIFLDHDLGDKVFVNSNEQNTGAEVARWIEQNPLESGQSVIIHSVNPSGAKYMMSAIKGAIHVPFVWMDSIFKRTFKQL